MQLNSIKRLLLPAEDGLTFILSSSLPSHHHHTDLLQLSSALKLT